MLKTVTAALHLDNKGIYSVIYKKSTVILGPFDAAFKKLKLLSPGSFGVIEQALELAKKGDTTVSFSIDSTYNLKNVNISTYDDAPMDSR